MASSVIKIAPMFDFQNESYFLIYAPNMGSGTVGLLSVNGTNSTTGSDIFTNIPIKDTDYDAGMGYYKVVPLITSPSFQIMSTGTGTQTGSGTVSVKFTSESAYIANYVYDSRGFNSTTPQGLAIVSNPCVSGTTRVIAYTEPKGPDHFSISDTGLSTLVDNTTSITYNSPTVVLTQNTPTYGAVFDLGFLSANITHNFRVIGKAGVGAGDYIDIPLFVTCTVSNCPQLSSGTPLSNGTIGTSYNQTLSFTGGTPFSLSNIVKPSWMTVTLSGSNVLLTGTPNVTGSQTVSFDITNSCGTLNVSESFTVSSGCINVSDGTINGNSNVTVGINETYTVTGLSGDAPFYYFWTVFGGIIASGQGTDTVSLIPSSSPMSIQCIVTNCSGNGEVTLNKIVNVKVNCSPTVYVKSNCFTVVGVTGTKSGVVEPNRVTSFTSTSITFTAEVGTHDYTFLLTDSIGIIHSVTFKNIVC